MQIKDKSNFLSSSLHRKKKTPAVRERPTGYEKNLQLLWASLPENTVLELENNKKAVLIFPGIRNLEKGPSFRNARIRFGSKILEGDVDIHCRVSDFIRHGHISDPDYANVILHGAKLNDLQSIPPRQLKKIPVFLFDAEKIRQIHETHKAKQEEKNTEKKEKRNIQEKEPEKEKSQCPVLAKLSPEEQKEFFRKAAEERLREKGEILLKNMISRGCNDAFLEQLFLFAGYPGNQEAFQRLFITFIHYPQEIRETKFRILLWGESGLLPDPAQKDLEESAGRYAKEYWQEFWQICTGNKNKPKWNRMGTLFGNTPERRLAMLCGLLEKVFSLDVKELAGKLKREGALLFLKNMDQIFTVSEPFWETHNSFHSPVRSRKRSLLSSSKRIIFYTDVLVPFLLAYGRLSEDPLLLKKTEEFFHLLPPPDGNSCITAASRLWYNGKCLPDSSAEMQGWMHIYKKHCVLLSHDCENCILAK